MMLAMIAVGVFVVGAGGVVLLYLLAALVHDSKLTGSDPNPEATHRPILYDSGRPSSVI